MAVHHGTVHDVSSDAVPHAHHVSRRGPQLRESQLR